MRRDPESLGLAPDGGARPLHATTTDPGSWPLSRAIQSCAGDFFGRGDR
jgi:hypothetical protein